MAGKFKWQKFSDIDLNDDFFDSLKSDYPEFSDWFQKKANNNELALVYNDSIGVGAFLYLKTENESITIVSGELLAKKRLKIGTLKLSERIRSQRLGEGALGVALWYWQQLNEKDNIEEIYVTAFEKHTELISLFDRFGFNCVGKNARGECVFIKNIRHLDFSDPYKCFPYISNSVVEAGVIPIEDHYHDKLFPYSELYGNSRDIEEITAGNGITKIFIATPNSRLDYKIGMPVFIYRKFTGIGPKTYKSVITSLCTISKIVIIKSNFVPQKSFEEFLNLTGNKTVYPENELEYIYNNKKNIIAIELVYNSYFGKGHNITHNELSSKRLFETYPYNIVYNRNELEEILELGDKDVQDIIIN
jgi:hypothetical protein